MKRNYFLIFFLCLAGCKKETTDLKSEIQGTWELVSSESGWGGHYDYDPGNGNLVSFDGNEYIQTMKSADSTCHYNGTFTIYTGKPCDFANEQTLIAFDSAYYANSFSLGNGRLTIGTTECIADGGSSTYRKIR